MSGDRIINNCFEHKFNHELYLFTYKNKFFNLPQFEFKFFCVKKSPLIDAKLTDFLKETRKILGLCRSFVNSFER